MAMVVSFESRSSSKDTTLILGLVLNRNQGKTGYFDSLASRFPAFPQVCSPFVVISKRRHLNKRPERLDKRLFCCIFGLRPCQQNQFAKGSNKLRAKLLRSAVLFVFDLEDRKLLTLKLEVTPSTSLLGLLI